MIAKSDFIILLISLSFLALGLYNHFELQGRANAEKRTSLLSSTLDNISKGGESFVDGTAQAWRVGLLKITGNAAGETAAVSESQAGKPIATAMVQSPKIESSITKKSARDPVRSQVAESSAATTAPSRQPPESAGMLTTAAIGKENQPFVQAPGQQADAITADTVSHASRYAAVTRIPGNATVLIISPNGNSSSDVKNQPGQTTAQTGQAAKIIASEMNSSATAPASINPQPAEQSARQEPRTEPPIRIYRVQGGETLTGIAETLGTTVDRLKEMNQLPDDRILAGQELVYETEQFATDVN